MNIYGKRFDSLCKRLMIDECKWWLIGELESTTFQWSAMSCYEIISLLAERSRPFDFSEIFTQVANVWRRVGASHDKLRLRHHDVPLCTSAHFLLGILHKIRVTGPHPGIAHHFLLQEHKNHEKTLGPFYVKKGETMNGCAVYCAPKSQSPVCMKCRWCFLIAPAIGWERSTCESMCTGSWKRRFMDAVL